MVGIAASTSTINAFILALLELFAETTWPALTGSTEPVYIFDGIPGPNAPDNYISVGGEQSPAASGSQTWAGAGATVRYEDYSVDLLISCYIGGDDNQGFNGTTPSLVSDAQMSARSNAFAILGAIETQIRGSGVQLVSVANPPQVLWAEVGTKIEVHQTTEDDPESGMGRICSILFDIHVKGRIGP